MAGIRDECERAGDHAADNFDNDKQSGQYSSKANPSAVGLVYFRRVAVGTVMVVSVIVMTLMIVSAHKRSFASKAAKSKGAISLHSAASKFMPL